MANIDTYIFIKWSDSDYSTGIESIDEQHKQLIVLINEIYQSFLNFNHLEVTAQVLDKLEDYAKMHFEYEERLFKKLSYPESEGHIEKHHAFTDKIAEFKRQMESGIDATFSITNYLRDWLRLHIQAEDRNYAPFFKKHGIS